MRIGSDPQDERFECEVVEVGQNAEGYLLGAQPVLEIIEADGVEVGDGDGEHERNIADTEMAEFDLGHRFTSIDNLHFGLRPNRQASIL